MSDSGLDKRKIILIGAGIACLTIAAIFLYDSYDLCRMVGC